MTRSLRFRPVRILFLTDTELARFLACFTAQRNFATSSKAHVPHVRHLFLTSTVGMISRKGCRVESKDDHELLKYEHGVARLLELIAADLHTLAVVSGFREWQDEILMPPFLA